jgi:G:T/U-mismatch repair DNA glycosylase
MKIMNDKDLYKQKLQAQLNEWKAELERLKAQAVGASADAQLEMHKLADELEGKLQAAKTQLAALSEAGEGTWDSMKSGLEHAWISVKTSVRDGLSRFKD